MSLEHVLLGMLREPQSGYDLRLEFEQGAKHYWSAELSQIYPTLKRMQSRGWLTSRQEPSARGPARRVYHRTAAGTEVLHDWLRSGPVIGTARFAYIGQLIHMGELNDLSATREFLEQLREELAAVWDLLRQVVAELEQTSQQRELDNFEFHDLISLRMGVHSLAAKVSWCDESLDAVDKRMATTMLPDSRSSL